MSVTHTATVSPSSASARRLPPTWRQLHPGEDPRIEAMQFARFRDAPPCEKMRMFVGLNNAARQLALTGLQTRYPEATERELRRLLADLLLGPELAERVYGPLLGCMGS